MAGDRFNLSDSVVVFDASAQAEADAALFKRINLDYIYANSQQNPEILKGVNYLKTNKLKARDAESKSLSQNAKISEASAAIALTCEEQLQPYWTLLSYETETKETEPKPVVLKLRCLILPEEIHFKEGHQFKDQFQIQEAFLALDNEGEWTQFDKKEELDIALKSGNVTTEVKADNVSDLTTLLHKSAFNIDYLVRSSKSCEDDRYRYFQSQQLEQTFKELSQKQTKEAEHKKERKVEVTSQFVPNSDSTKFTIELDANALADLIYKYDTPSLSIGERKKLDKNFERYHDIIFNKYLQFDGNKKFPTFADDAKTLSQENKDLLEIKIKIAEFKEILLKLHVLLEDPDNIIDLLQQLNGRLIKVRTVPELSTRVQNHIAQVNYLIDKVETIRINNLRAEGDIDSANRFELRRLREQANDIELMQIAKNQYVTGSEIVLYRLFMMLNKMIHSSTTKTTELGTLREESGYVLNMLSMLNEIKDNPLKADEKKVEPEKVDNHTNRLLALQAIEYARGHIRVGYTEQALISPHITHEILKFKEGVGAVRGIKINSPQPTHTDSLKNIVRLDMNDDLYQREHYNEQLSKFSIGNCEELAFLAVNAIVIHNANHPKNQVYAEAYYIVHGDHVLALIARDLENSDPTDPSTFGDDAYFFDPWSKKVGKAKEYMSFINNYAQIPGQHFLQPLTKYHKLKPYGNYNTDVIGKRNDEKYLNQMVMLFKFKIERLINVIIDLKQGLFKFKSTMLSELKLSKNHPLVAFMSEKIAAVDKILANLSATKDISLTALLAKKRDAADALSIDNYIFIKRELQGILKSNIQAAFVTTNIRMQEVEKLFESQASVLSALMQNPTLLRDGPAMQEKLKSVIRRFNRGINSLESLHVTMPIGPSVTDKKKESKTHIVEASIDKASNLLESLSARKILTEKDAELIEIYHRKSFGESSKSYDEVYKEISSATDPLVQAALLIAQTKDDTMLLRFLQKSDITTEHKSFRDIFSVPLEYEFTESMSYILSKIDSNTINLHLFIEDMLENMEDDVGNFYLFKTNCYHLQKLINFMKPEHLSAEIFKSLLNEVEDVISEIENSETRNAEANYFLETVVSALFNKLKSRPDWKELTANIDFTFIKNWKQKILEDKTSKPSIAGVFEKNSVQPVAPPTSLAPLILNKNKNSHS